MENEINVRFEELAREAADSWRSVYLNFEASDPGNKQNEEKIVANIHKRMEASLLEGIADYAVRRMQELDGKNAQKIADAMIDRWIKDGELCIEEPPERLKQLIESALEDVESRPQVFLHAARQRKVRALALAEAKVPMAQIAKELGVTKRTASKWIEDERSELEEIKKTLLIYGYRMEKIS